MDTQTAYETIRAYFDRPGAVLAQENGFLCKYRTPEGNKCAVGCLIPDEVYSEQMEGSALRPYWLDRFPSVAELLSNVDKKFLRSAQLLHDRVAKDANAFVRGLDIIALASGLNVPAQSLIHGDDFLGCV